MAPKKTRSEVVDVVTDGHGLVNADEQFVQQVGTAVTGFLRTLSAFFGKAVALEHTAKQNLAVAQRWIPPDTPEQDEEIQVFIKKVREDKRSAEEHWSITSTVSQFHKRLTAARARTTDLHENAAAIMQRLHNDFVERERRRVAAEVERDRLAKEAVARAERERELAALEAEALKREAEAPDLSDREQFFVKLVAGGNLPTVAAQLVGYKNPDQHADRLMKTVKVTAAIQQIKDAAALRQQAEAKRAAPIEVAAPVDIKPNVIRAAGAQDRTTWSAEIVDERRLRRACLDEYALAVLAWAQGQGFVGPLAAMTVEELRGLLQMQFVASSIPTDILVVSPPKVNEYARSLHELIDAWPGVRHIKKTTTV